VALQRRALDRRGAPWFRQMLDQLFSEGNAAAAPAADADAATSSAIRPLLLASLASMTLHTESASDAATIWLEVAATSKRITDPVLSTQLLARATLAAIGQAGHQRGVPTDPSALWQMLDEWWKPIEAVLVGSFMSAIESQVERAETDPLGPAAMLTMASGSLVPWCSRNRLMPRSHRLSRPGLCARRAL